MPGIEDEGAIAAREVLARKGIDASVFSFPVAILHFFKGMADVPWWTRHSARFSPRRVRNPRADDTLLHWGKVISSVPVSLWNIEESGVPIVFAGPVLGGPCCSIVLEELKVLGLRYAIGVGAAGSFSERLSVHDVILPDRAIASDGASRYYRDAACVHPSERLLDLTEKTAREQGIATKRSFVWQSDALYRETNARRRSWREQGAECVNGETSTLFAVSTFLGIESVYLGWITDSTVPGEWTGWGGGVWTEDKAAGSARSPLHDLEDLAVTVARYIKSNWLGEV